MTYRIDMLKLPGLEIAASNMGDSITLDVRFSSVHVVSSIFHRFTDKENALVFAQELRNLANDIEKSTQHLKVRSDQEVVICDKCVGNGKIYKSLKEKLEYPTLFKKLEYPTVNKSNSKPDGVTISEYWEQKRKEGE